MNETAFLLDVAPGAVTNGVTPLKVVELGSTNVLVAVNARMSHVPSLFPANRELMV